MRRLIVMLPKCVSIGQYIFTQCRVDKDGVQYYNIQRRTDICVDYNHPFSSIKEMQSWVSSHS